MQDKTALIKQKFDELYELMKERRKDDSEVATLFMVIEDNDDYDVSARGATGAAQSLDIIYTALFKSVTN